MIEYKKQHNIVRLNKRWIFWQFWNKNNSEPYWSTSKPINMQTVLQIFFLLKITKLYLIIAKWQMFSITENCNLFE